MNETVRVLKSAVVRLREMCVRTVHKEADQSAEKGEPAEDNRKRMGIHNFFCLSLFFNAQSVNSFD